MTALHGRVPNDRAEAGIIIVFLLVGLDESQMLGRLDLFPRIASDNPALGRLRFHHIQVFGITCLEADDLALLEEISLIAFRTKRFNSAPKSMLNIASGLHGIQRLDRRSGLELSERRPLLTNEFHVGTLRP